MYKKTIRWNTILGACLISLVGCGGTAPVPGPGGGGGGGGGGGTNVPGCGSGCDRGFVCQTSTCVVNPTGFWTLRLTSGTVAARDASGSHWDADFSAPDPKVCLTINGNRSCTTAMQDTNAPVWNEDFPRATAVALQSGVTVEYLDSDFSSDDSICSGTVPVSATSFTSGVWGFSCQGGLGQVSALLTAQ